MNTEQLLEKMLENVRAGDDICSGIQSNHRGKWEDVPYPLSIRALTKNSIQFRIKPRTRNICGFEVPAPEVNAPAYGEEYYILDTYRKDGIYLATWSDVRTDENALRNGLWLNKADAIANRTALCGEDPYE